MLTMATGLGLGASGQTLVEVLELSMEELVERLNDDIEDHLDEILELLDEE